MIGKMEELLIFPHEIEQHTKLFEVTPLCIISTYLQCFRSDGSQARLVPKHVLEALARRFLSVMSKESNSLDQAFGGKIARQRNRLIEYDREGGILWDLMRAKEEVDAEAPTERGPGTPFEIAVERVADELDMSAHNVLRIYGKTAKQ